ncbi:uncharacterized protein F5891DRAFT_1183629 [Suillus fuscotomentosus]|uniref:Uncharacterized protein n=1 Tax=Suillus fuscotomentosus TaxID=1912939 RepID=A0AAD4EF42_9AGAM|nr:uncharacterized protein F5891DRAFT_1183629 [Suillus fuscotomentosus]KAG1904972.1 hypothetical protein F5891DRAFT_1183629 [Suillus fuscotomentosus]
MPTALSMFKSNTTLWDGWLQAFDACAVAVQGKLVITMPKMDFVPTFQHFEEENVQARADGHFGAMDCFQWLQAYNNEAFPSLHPLHWAWFTPTQEDFKPIPGNSFPVGTLAADKVEGLDSLRKLAEKRVQDWRANRQGKNDAVVSRILSLRHGISWLKTYPLTFCDLLMFVTDAQRLFLEIHSFMDWILLAQPHITASDRTAIVNLEWMGAFTHDSDMCNKLYIAGIPVWYVRTTAYIPSNMTVKQPVLLTYPNQIILSMYAEANKVQLYEIIHHGPGGNNRQLHVRHLYGGTTFKDPEPGPSSGPSSSSLSAPSSSTAGPSSQPSVAGKALQKHHNKKHRHQPYVKDARPAHHNQSGESIRDKWKDPESPYFPPSKLHWDDALKRCIKDSSRVPQTRSPIQSQAAGAPSGIYSHLARLSSNMDWQNFCPITSRSAQRQSPPKKGLTVAEKCKGMMKDLLGDDMVDSHRDLFAPEGMVEFRGEQVPVASLAHPPQLLAQKITWELFELGFRYELRDLDHHLAKGCWAEDPVGHEQLLHAVFPGETGLVMWSEPFPMDNYRMWNNTLTGVLPYLESLRQLLCSWDDVLPLLTSPLMQESFTDTKLWEVTCTATVFYVQMFFDHFGRPPIVPHSLPL